MQLGMVGLGRMGANIVRRLIRAGHECVVFDVNPDKVEALERENATGSGSLRELAAKLAQPRAVWIMVPAGGITGKTVADLSAHLDQDDVIIDGGNSYYRDDVDRAKTLAESGIHYVDVGTSGGVWGLERGYCLMIGGAERVVDRLRPIFETLSPGVRAAAAHQAGKASRPPPSTAIYTAAPLAPATSSRWSTTASSTA